jgi:hypothetical protein
MTGVEIGLGIASALGGGAQVYGQIKGASAQSEAAYRSAEFKRMQADEILAREMINEETIKKNSARVESSYFTSFAATGTEGGLGGVLQIQKQTEENLINARRDSEFKANQLRMGANIEQSLASDAMAASYITGAGTILGFGAKAYSLYHKSSSSQSLPTVEG